ncbi:hypothetical protein HJC23_000675 [Cyclotella cryptica]|uniref:50S ribosomal protein L22, chloroplastic n=1 Tax=Cyclotella cryptica TaxID=29204 RepID=A0ABD3QA27_9STRA|eukprot:CCRYP_007345-RA/>CCRYP_007345-RA protein AED:0.07 eAED:0.07 QI:232/1/1/1/1/1/3/422/295
MASFLASRMSRLVIGGNFTPTHSRSTIRSVSNSPINIFSRLCGSAPSSLVSLNIVHNLGFRSSSSVQHVIPANYNDDFGATSRLSSLLTQSQAENFAAFTYANRHQKVKPFIIKRRRNLMRTYIGNERDIRHSPWRMNLVCQFAAGQTVPEALKQLMFCQKMHAPTVAKVIRRTANLADIRHGLQPSQLEVAECFATHGRHLKRLKIMGRGRSGKKLRRFSHIRLVLREIDFPTKLLEASTINQKRKWLNRLSIAREDYEKAQIEKAELAELETKAAELEAARKKKLEEEEKGKK